MCTAPNLSLPFSCLQTKGTAQYRPNSSHTNLHVAIIVSSSGSQCSTRSCWC